MTQYNTLHTTHTCGLGCDVIGFMFLYFRSIIHFVFKKPGPSHPWLVFTISVKQTNDYGCLNWRLTVTSSRCQIFYWYLAIVANHIGEKTDVNIDKIQIKLLLQILTLQSVLQIISVGISITKACFIWGMMWAEHGIRFWVTWVSGSPRLVVQSVKIF